MTSTNNETRKVETMNAEQITVKGKTFSVRLTDDRKAGNDWGVRIWEIKDGGRVESCRKYQRFATEPEAIAVYEQAVTQIKAL